MKAHNLYYYQTKCAEFSIFLYKLNILYIIYYFILYKNIKINFFTYFKTVFKLNTFLS